MTHDRAGYFQLHTLCLDCCHDLDEIVAHQPQLQFLGIRYDSCDAPWVWQNVKRLYQSKLWQRRTSPRPVVFIRDTTMYRITLFPAFYCPREVLPVFRASDMYDNLNGYYCLSLSLLGISEDNTNLLNEAMDTICVWDDSRWRLKLKYKYLCFIVHETTVQVSADSNSFFVHIHPRATEAMATSRICQIHIAVQTFVLLTVPFSRYRRRGAESIFRGSTSASIERFGVGEGRKNHASRLADPARHWPCMRPDSYKTGQVMESLAVVF